MALVGFGVIRRMDVSDVFPLDGLNMAISLPSRTKLFESIVQSLPQGVLVVDEALRVVVYNRRVKDLLPARVRRVRGRSVLDLIPHDSLPARIRDVFQDHTARELELRPERESPEALTALRIVINPVADNELVLLVVEDVSERVLGEDALVELERLVAMRQLARSVAHELGNPLGVVQFALQHVHECLETQGSRELADYVQRVVENVHRMDELLRTISDFGPQRPPCFEPTDITRLITEVSAFIQLEAQPRQVEMRLRVAEPPAVCMLDRRRMKQVFLNLFKNALDAMPRGGVLEVASRVVAGDGGDRLIIAVKDTGEGIAEEHLGSVFRPLFSTKAGGMGLGLAFCREVVEEHGGEISIKSSRGRGTTVMISLSISR